MLRKLEKKTYKNQREVGASGGSRVTVQESSNKSHKEGSMKTNVKKLVLESGGGGDGTPRK